MRHRLILLMAMLLLISSGIVDQQWIQISSQASADDPLALYKPKHEDYRQGYEADTANRAKQSWETHYEWVETFYRGSFLASGWTRQSEQVISHVKKEKARREVIALVNQLGRKISQEWSKDNSIRRIDTAALKRFSEQIDQSTRQDNGSGAKILAALNKIRDEVTSKLK